MLEMFDTRSHSDEVLAVLRRLAINARLKGHSNQQVADILDLRPETVSRWWATYQREGEASLPHGRSGRPAGTGRRLSQEQERQVQQWITEQTPEELGVASATWTRPAVQRLIRLRLGIELAVRTVGKYLARWGFTPQRPRKQSRQQDPEEVRQWVEEEFPALSRQAEREDAALHFADETGISLENHGGRSYSPKGCTPTLPVSGHRGRVNLISSISREGEIFFLLFSGSMNGGRFLRFLQALIEFVGRKVLLIVDRHPAHDSAQVEAWLDEHRDEIEVHFLPRYSPELNADEYLNNDLKQTLEQEPLADSVPDLRATILGFLERLAELPERVASYFRHPDVAYSTA